MYQFQRVISEYCSNFVLISLALLILSVSTTAMAQNNRTMSGTITLPAGVISDGTFSVTGGVEERDVNGNFIRRTAFFENIAENVNSTDYHVDYPEPEPGNQLSISFRCFNNCSDVDGSRFDTFWLQNDGSFGLISSQLDPSVVPATLDFTFPGPPSTLLSLSGTITLPTGVVSDGTIFVNGFVEERDVNGNLIRSSTFLERFAENANATDYRVDYPEPQSGTQLRVGFVCNSNCAAVDGKQFIIYELQSDGRFIPQITTIDPSAVPTTLDFIFPGPPATLSLSGTITLPDGVVSDGKISVLATVDERNPRGGSLFSYSFFAGIAENDNSIDYMIFYTEPREGNQLRVSFDCRSNCTEVDAFPFTPFVLQSDGSFSPKFTQIDPSAVPATLDFTFPEPPSGQVESALPAITYLLLDD